MAAPNPYALLTRSLPGIVGRRVLDSVLANVLIVAFAMALCACAPDRSEWPARGMNLLLVTVDTTRADLLSCYGGDPRTTPNLDRLAKGGVRFSSSYSATNVTKPAHLSLLTGKRSIEHGVFNNQVLIPEGTVALPALMKRAGYRTAAFVAAVQLGEGTGWEGFDVVKGPPGKKPQRIGSAVVDDALAWLGRGGDGPFFLWTHFFDPHSLYEPPAKFARRFYDGDPRAGSGPLLGDAEWFRGWRYPPMKRWIDGVRDEAYAPAMYAAEMQFTDGEIQRLLDALDARGERDETVVVMTADHGESLGEHGIWYDHTGLYEVSLRIPLIIDVPGFPGGVVRDELVTQLDLVPTVSDLFGLGVRGGGGASGGRSLRPLLTGESDFAPYEFLLFESAHNHQVALRKGRWKLIVPVTKDHRFLTAEPELFDLESDPEELRNRYADEPEVVAELEPLAAPWVALGTIEKGTLPEMSSEVLDGLDDLGYAGDDE